MVNKDTLKTPESPENLEIILKKIRSGLKNFKRSGIFKTYSCESPDYENLIVGILEIFMFEGAKSLCKEGRLNLTNNLFDSVSIIKPNIEDIVNEYKKDLEKC